MNGKGPFDPRKDAHLLSGYVDGELDADEQARVTAHLQTNEAARQEVARLQQLKQLTGALRLKEPPAEEWEVFWSSVYNRTERSVGWLLVTVGVMVLGAWGAWRLLEVLLGTDSLPLALRVGVLTAAAGVLFLVVSVVRERIYKRGRTRYKDVIR